MLVVLIVAELALVWTISAATERLSAGAATGLFLLYSALNGLTLSAIFLAYAHATLASAFVVTAGMFGAMSLYGMFTRRDLTGMGSFLFMALIGLILASLVSLFWHNSMLVTLINYAGVLIFVGLTAYDTQVLKFIAVATANDPRAAARLSINGALRLYLDFLNLFLLLLRIMGNRRN
jgi:FtsH-binding integral membrane protein